MTNSLSYSTQLAQQARVAATALANVTAGRKNAWLRRVADTLRDDATAIVAANAIDLDAGADSGLSPAMLDRLKLTPDSIDSLASAVGQIIALPDPVGEVIEGQRRPNGLYVSRVRVPLGVVFFIYESRPNVTIDAAALCVKSGNAVILRGGKEAIHSNRALQAVIEKTLVAEQLPQHAVQLVESTDREIVGHLLSLGNLIDVTIPRGGKSLIERVAREATMPVIKHFDGICHVFVDASADEKMAVEITVNSKCQRPGVCNAAETLLIHQAAAPKLWPQLAKELQSRGVELRCCPVSLAMISNGKPATDEDYATEYLDLILSVRIVESIDQAIEHIRRFGSAHTDAIVTNSVESAMKFEAEVDSAAVVINASTRFNDGGELGMGAEIGISTDRFHARGPCGLRELTSYKFVVRGEGQIRS
ncbi:MAG TPA: glutamate-5-semialdehyde dehydrogenase [Planctomycetaceae bacterium]|nr:glutamate-5-semialdehyde dehydrogenase [Planctomycetaceae bacterium]